MNREDLRYLRYLPVIFLWLIAACATSPRNESGWANLESAIRNRISQVEKGFVAVSFIDLRTKRELHINSDTVLHAASTMKVPVLLALYRRADQDRSYSLDRRIPVRNQFQSIADTSHYALDAGDDSDSSVYKLIGDSASLRYLARRMIVRSSNLATNLLIDELGAARVREVTALAGGKGVTVLRGVEDGPAYRKGMNNTVTSYGLAKTLEAIERCTVTSRAACKEMLEILSSQEFNEMIPAGLPKGTKVAHKTGWTSTVQHDAAIVYPAGRKPYILVVLTRGIADTAVAARVGADVSRMVFQNMKIDDFLSR